MAKKKKKNNNPKNLMAAENVVIAADGHKPPKKRKKMKREAYERQAYPEGDEGRDLGGCQPNHAQDAGAQQKQKRQAPEYQAEFAGGDEFHRNTWRGLGMPGPRPGDCVERS